MFLEVVAVMVTAVGIAAIVYAVQSSHRRQTQLRLAINSPTDSAGESTAAVRSTLRRFRWVPWATGLTIAAGLYYLSSLAFVYCLVCGLLLSLLGGQVEAMVAERRAFRMEVLLADAIDLMVGTLRAGAGVLNALENASTESRPPLHGLLKEIAGRIRLGDPASEVFQDLAAQVPLESYLLLSSALSVHWEVGGSLAPTLATVGRTIRDRIELTRRVRAMTAQARMSTIGVLLASYAIAAIMWANDPHRMEQFLVSDMGSLLVATAMIMQAVGIVWSSAIARIRF